MYQNLPIAYKFGCSAQKQICKELKRCNKTLKVVYNTYKATYDELFALDNKLKIHQRHLPFLAIEMYKSKNKLNSIKNIPYSRRSGIPIFILNGNTQKYGINSLNFRGSVLWNKLAIKLKECKSLQEFKLM